VDPVGAAGLMLGDGRSGMLQRVMRLGRKWPRKRTWQRNGERCKLAGERGEGGEEDEEKKEGESDLRLK